MAFSGRLPLDMLVGLSVFRLGLPLGRAFFCMRLGALLSTDLLFYYKTVDLAKMSWLGFVVLIWGSFVLVGGSLSGFAVRDLNLRFRQRTAAQDTPRDFCCTFGFHSSAQGEA